MLKSCDISLKKWFRNKILATENCLDESIDAIKKPLLCCTAALTHAQSDSLVV